MDGNLNDWGYLNQDEVGIVAKLSECIASRGGNILNADIFVPEKENVFYARRFRPSPISSSFIISCIL